MIGKLREAIPGVMDGFSKMAASATETKALDSKTKELLALGLSVAARCDGCIGFHVKKLVSLKVTKEEFMETLGMAIYMGGGPSLMYAAEALMAYEEFTVA